MRFHIAYSVALWYNPIIAIKNENRKAVILWLNEKHPNKNLEELEKKMEQLKAQKKAIQAKQSKLERAQRTRRLIENGALAEKNIFRCEKVEPADFEKLLQKLVTIDTVKTIIKGNVNE